MSQTRSRTNFDDCGLVVLLLAVALGATLSGCALVGSSAQGTSNGSLSASSGSFDFGSVPSGTTATQTITLSNQTAANLTITQAVMTGTGFTLNGLALPLTLGAGKNTSFNVSFTPPGTGDYTGRIVFSTNPPSSPLSLSLHGTATQSGLTANPTKVDFGNVMVGQAATQNITLTNTGSAAVSISKLTASGTGFSATGPALPLSLGANQSTAFSLKFAPQSMGSVTGSISLVSNAGNSPTTIALSGTGVQPQISVAPNSVGFGNVTVGTANSQVMILTNSGTADLTVSQATISGSGFGISGLSLPLTLGTAQKTSFNVAFNPASTGGATGGISLVSNAPNSPTTIALSGTGIAATQQLMASAANLNFGNVNVGSSNTQTITLTNTGNSTVTVSQVNVSGVGFSASGVAPPLTLLSQQTASLSVKFAPTAAGSKSGSVSVASNASNSPTTIALTGTGVQTIAHSATLSWDASTSTVAGYYVYRGTQSGGPYTKLNSSPVSGLSFTDNSVQAGQSYFYVATATDSNGVESAFSNEISAAIPTP